MAKTIITIQTQPESKPADWNKNQFGAVVAKEKQLSALNTGYRDEKKHLEKPGKAVKLPVRRLKWCLLFKKKKLICADIKRPELNM